MKYICKNCGKEYTIPQGDHLIEKRQICKCGSPAKLFGLKKHFIVKSRSEIYPAVLFSK